MDMPKIRKLEVDTVPDYLDWDYRHNKHEEEINALIKEIQERKDEIMPVIMQALIEQMKTRRGRTSYITMDSKGVYTHVYGKPVSTVLAKIDDSVIDEQATLAGIAKHLILYMPDFYKKANDIYNHALLTYSKFGGWREYY